MLTVVGRDRRERGQDLQRPPHRPPGVPARDHAADRRPVVADVVLRQAQARRRVAGRPATRSAAAGSSSARSATFQSKWQLTNPKMVLFGRATTTVVGTPRRCPTSRRSTRSIRSPRASTRGTSSAPCRSRAPSSTTCPTCCRTPCASGTTLLDGPHGARLDPRARRLGQVTEGPAAVPVRGGVGHPAGAGPAPPRAPRARRPGPHRRPGLAAGGVRRAAAVRADRRPARDRRADRGRPGPAASR